MARSSRNEPKARRPATTLEGRENQVIAMAVDLAERQIADGTASSQIITHFLKLGSTTAQLEKERLVYENRLMEAKIEAMRSTRRIEELYEDAILAMRVYSGQDPMDDYDNDN